MVLVAKDIVEKEFLSLSRETTALEGARQMKARRHGCSLAATIDGEKLRAWRNDHPNAVVVSYINTTAEVKAESDYVCTSGNAVKVVNSIPRDREILFLPDLFLGAFVKE